jgi:beta-glucosidase/6-phospho-beta-glucosidase/beta-galactosidase
MAGFESACHINPFGDRVDMVAGVEHDKRALEDYRNLRRVNMRTARDGVRWHLVDRGGGYDFSSFLPMLEAARETGTQVIWNLCHYGWPDGLDVFSGEFIDRFAGFAKAVARVVCDGSQETPFFTPINEVSFLAWAASRNVIYPFAHGKDNELKHQLVRATIAACDAILDVHPGARFVYPEPVVYVVTPRDQPAKAVEAASYNEAQYEAWDMIGGCKEPWLGGSKRYLDIVGVNYYHSNQWEHGGQRLRWEDEPRDDRWLPFREMVARVWRRYRRPVCITETSHFGSGRARWIREIGREVRGAIEMGVPVEGICLYPILDRYDWENKNHWHNSGLWDLVRDGTGLRRVINEEYREALQEAQALLAGVGV